MTPPPGPEDRSAPTQARDGLPAQLSRDAGHGRPAAPVRMLHLGLGSFSRAHQAWYTEHAPDADRWGIAGWTGRSAGLADALRPQGGLYTLLVHGPGGDRVEVVSSLSSVHAAADHGAWLGHWRAAATSVVTLTVTEAAYLRGADGHLDDTRDDVRADVAALRADPAAAATTVPGRLVAGLAARRAAGAGPVTVLPCDNLPGNGGVVATVVDDLARAVDPSLARWVGSTVAFGTTMVDRITPATAADDAETVLRLSGLRDAAPVPTEQFSEWVLAADFPAGRPRWEESGATMVDDVGPFEERKLWLLNGAHSLMAYAGPLRGHTTTAEAVADPEVRGWVEQWWDEAERHVRLPAAEVTAYRGELLARFGNPGIRHALAQVGADGTQKMPVRFPPVIRAELEAGRLAAGALRAVAAWTAHLRGSAGPVRDAGADALRESVTAPDAEAVTAVLEHLDGSLARDERVRDAVLDQLQALSPRR